jgi:hypothetical protein
MPVKNQKGETIAVIQALNKKISRINGGFQKYFNTITLSNKNKINSISSSPNPTTNSISTNTEIEDHTKSNTDILPEPILRKKLERNPSIPWIYSNDNHLCPHRSNPTSKPSSRPLSRSSTLLSLHTNEDPTSHECNETCIDLDDIDNFNRDDEEMLSAFCAEIRNLLLKRIRDAMIELNQVKMTDSIYSLMVI